MSPVHHDLAPRGDVVFHVRKQLRTVLIAAAAFYLFLSLEALLVTQSAARTAMTLAAAGAAAAFLGLGGLLRMPQLPDRWIHPVGLAGGAVVLAHAALGLGFEPGSVDAGQIGIAVVGAALIFASSGWLVAFAAATLGGFAVAVALIPAAAWTNESTFGVFAALVTAFVVHRFRMRSLTRFAALHEEAEKQREAREHADERFRLAVEGSNDGVYDWDLVTGEIYYSPRWQSIAGACDKTLSVSPDEWLRRVHPDDLERLQAGLQLHWEGNQQKFEVEHRLGDEEAGYRWVLARGVSKRDEEGRAIRMAGSITDMSARGLFDPLTGLPNRRLLLERIERAMASGARNPQGFAVLFVDLDRFKIVNDSMGHQVGDQVLIEAAGRLQTCVRASDTVARIGGDEFVILLDRIDLPGGALITVERIESKLAEPLTVEGRELFLTASVGAVLDTRSYEVAEDLVRDADTAMYEAKQHDRKWVVFDVAMRDKLAERLRLEGELRRALDREEFLIHYQPIVSIDDGGLVAYEALVRWEHPDRGLVPPAGFIGFMEENGLIVDLGRWVLREACREMQMRFPGSSATGAPALSVNLSRRQLRPELVGEVARTLEETGFDPKRLKLEVTETAILEQPDLAADTLHALKALGVQILMDDFGTGHSSLGVLQVLPIDQLKIDRSFIQRLGVDHEGTELVRGIITMCQTLGLRVVAEGIERDDQLASLREFDCDLGQGYLFARPTTLPKKDEATAAPSAPQPVGATPVTASDVGEKSPS